MATIKDVEALGYRIGVAQDHAVTVWRVEGPGVSLMVRDDDREAIDSLADPAAHDERVFQHRHPELVEVVQRLRGAGRTVTRKVGETSFLVDGAHKTPAQLIKLAEVTRNRSSVAELAAAIAAAPDAHARDAALLDWARQHAVQPT